MGEYTVWRLFYLQTWLTKEKASSHRTERRKEEISMQLRSVQHTEQHLQEFVVLDQGWSCLVFLAQAFILVDDP
jgi:hypothetical protein